MKKFHTFTFRSRLYMKVAEGEITSHLQKRGGVYNIHKLLEIGENTWWTNFTLSLFDQGWRWRLQCLAGALQCLALQAQPGLSCWCGATWTNQLQGSNVHKNLAFTCLRHLGRLQSIVGRRVERVSIQSSFFPCLGLQLALWSGWHLLCDLSVRGPTSQNLPTHICSSGWTVESSA